jgi:hypothetical protein
MQAKLRSLSSPDVDDLRNYAPGEEAFRVMIRALIGPANGREDESFDFEVCSPEWLLQKLEHEQVISGRFRLFMTAFSYEVIEQFVLKQIAQATGANWSEVANKLARWSQWEFEDYAERR